MYTLQKSTCLSSTRIQSLVKHIKIYKNCVLYRCEFCCQLKSLIFFEKKKPVDPYMFQNQTASFDNTSWLVVITDQMVKTVYIFVVFLIISEKNNGCKSVPSVKMFKAFENSNNVFVNGIHVRRYSKCNFCLPV